MPASLYRPSLLPAYQPEGLAELREQYFGGGGGGGFRNPWGANVLEADNRFPGWEFRDLQNQPGGLGGVVQRYIAQSGQASFRPSAIPALAARMHITPGFGNSPPPVAGGMPGAEADPEPAAPGPFGQRGASIFAPPLPEEEFEEEMPGPDPGGNGGGGGGDYGGGGSNLPDYNYQAREMPWETGLRPREQRLAQEQIEREFQLAAAGMGPIPQGFQPAAGQHLRPAERRRMEENARRAFEIQLAGGGDWRPNQGGQSAARQPAPGNGNGAGQNPNHWLTPGNQRPGAENPGYVWKSNPSGGNSGGGSGSRQRRRGNQSNAARIAEDAQRIDARPGDSRNANIRNAQRDISGNIVGGYRINPSTGQREAFGTLAGRSREAREDAWQGYAGATSRQYPGESGVDWVNRNSGNRSPFPQNRSMPGESGLDWLSRVNAGEPAAGTARQRDRAGGGGSGGFPANLNLTPADREWLRGLEAERDARNAPTVSREAADAQNAGTPSASDSASLDNPDERADQAQTGAANGIIDEKRNVADPGGAGPANRNPFGRSGGRRMVNAYGNKFAKTMTAARGDLARA